MKSSEITKAIKEGTEYKLILRDFLYEFLDGKQEILICINNIISQEDDPSRRDELYTLKDLIEEL